MSPAFAFVSLQGAEQKFDYPAEVLNKYAICNEIGKGASGVVHLVVEKVYFITIIITNNYMPSIVV